MVLSAIEKTYKEADRIQNLPSEFFSTTCV